MCPAGCCSPLPSSATKTEQGLGSPCWSTMSCDFSCRASGLDVSPARGGGNAIGSVGTVGEEAQPLRSWFSPGSWKKRRGFQSQAGGKNAGSPVPHSQCHPKSPVSQLLVHVSLRRKQKGTTFQNRASCKTASPMRLPGTIAKGEPLEARQIALVPSPGFLPFPSLERHKDVQLQRD